MMEREKTFVTIEKLQANVIELVKACQSRALLEEILEKLLPNVDVGATNEPSRRWSA